jgi:hypothetical protein
LDLPDHHLSYKSLREMLNFQAEGVMQELKEDLKKCKSLGILIDESEEIKIKYRLNCLKL